VSWYLGVDAGNSKTVAVLVDETGQVCGRGRTGCGDKYNAPNQQEAVDAVTTAARQALADAGIARVDGAAFRMAGLDWPEDFGWWSRRLEQSLPPIAALDVGNDGLASLRLGTSSGIGVAITVGTGPAIGARSAVGRESWSGWWIFHNLGGNGLVDDAMAAVCRAWMGLGPATSLTDALLGLHGQPDVWHLRHALTCQNDEHVDLNKRGVVRAVLESAEAGDEVAHELVVKQGEAFAEYAVWVAGQAGIDASDAIPVVVNGSVATSQHGIFRQVLNECLARVFPAARLLVATAPPVNGCVLDALAIGGVELTDDLWRRIAVTPHPAEFLAT